MRAWFTAENRAASFGHHAPEAPKPVIVWAGIGRTRTAAIAGASAPPAPPSRRPSRARPGWPRRAEISGGPERFCRGEGAA